MDLRARFARLCLPYQGEVVDRAFDDLVARYGEPHRHYHTMAHVEACLAELDHHVEHTENFSALELALFYHDAIYDTRADGNEARSARLCENLVEVLSPDPRAVVPSLLVHQLREAAKLILATKHEGSPLHKLDARWIVDIDLTILGQPHEVYARYAEAIRHEYSWVPEEAYRAGRTAVLTAFLSGDIFHTDFYRTKYEAQARANIRAEIAELGLLQGTP